MSTPSPTQPWYRSLTREQWFVFIVASLAWLFDCMDQQFFNLGRDGAMADLLTDKSKVNVYGPDTTSVFLLGWGTGGLIFGALGDRFGRAKILTFSILLYSLFTGLSCFSTGFFDFCVYRFITGVGVGGVFGLAVALVADSVSDEARAPALGLLQSLSTVGNLSAGLLGMLIGAVAVLPFGMKPWQAMFLVGSLPALLCVVVMTRLKEPEKWVKAREAGIKSGIKFGSYASLLGHPRWKRHAWFALIACSAGIIGLWGIGNFHPTIVRSLVGEHLAAKNLSAADLAREKAFWGSVGLLLQNVGAFFGMVTFALAGAEQGPQVGVRARAAGVVPVDAPGVLADAALQPDLLDDPDHGLRSTVGICGVRDLPTRTFPDQPAQHGYELLLQRRALPRRNRPIHDGTHHRQFGRRRGSVPHRRHVGQPRAARGHRGAAAAAGNQGSTAAGRVIGAGFYLQASRPSGTPFLWRQIGLDSLA
jgi:MFS family permease